MYSHINTYIYIYIYILGADYRGVQTRTVSGKTCQATTTTTTNNNDNNNSSSSSTTTTTTTNSNDNNNSNDIGNTHVINRRGIRPRRTATASRRRATRTPA